MSSENHDLHPAGTDFPKAPRGEVRTPVPAARVELESDAAPWSRTLGGMCTALSAKPDPISLFHALRRRWALAAG
ncbi:MAG: hypothetical protein HY000_39125, partial [Planctomycetes bacterium]|nr:hypothetical protein [Planctomycetota bacterium]